MCLPECQIIYTDGVRAGEVMDNPITHSNTCMSDEGQDPGNQGKWGPHYAEREPSIFWVNLGNVA